MTYNETIEYLYNAAPAFTKVGASAYKEGLSNTIALDEHSGHPHQKYLTVHVAGTNGKGSCSHTLAAILQQLEIKEHDGTTRKLRVGLYTSPHLVTFRERIRVNGEMISEDYVVDWVERNKAFFTPLSPSFFELATAMAFEYFAYQKVDIAVIEVGLGGRLDCTNIISPILSVITNISFDHTQFLGNTLAKIAGEKAGIIKQNTPVVIGEYTHETRPVFEQKAKVMNAPIIFAEDNPIRLDDCDYELKGLCQEKNRQTILNCLVPLARQLKKSGIKLLCISHVCESPLHFARQQKPSLLTVKAAFENVCEMTGLMGRWQKISDKPLTICDTGHNVAGWEYLSKQISSLFTLHSSLRIVFGMVDDKDFHTVMNMLPKEAQYYFTQASTHRALPAETVADYGQSIGLKGAIYHSVTEAYQAAQKEASDEDFIFIGGSSYIVADLLSDLDVNNS